MVHSIFLPSWYAANISGAQKQSLSLQNL